MQHIFQTAEIHVNCVSGWGRYPVVPSAVVNLIARGCNHYFKKLYRNSIKAKAPVVFVFL